MLMMGIETMKAFGADESMFQVYINHRHLIDTFLSQYSDDTQELVRLLDKWNKLSESDMKKSLSEIGIDAKGVEAIFGFMQAESVEQVAKLFPALTELQSFNDLQKILEIMKSL